MSSAKTVLLHNSDITQQVNYSTKVLKDYKRILFKYYFNSEDYFENKGKLGLIFPFSFDYLDIKILNKSTNDLIEYKNYKNKVFAANLDTDDYLITVTDNDKINLIKNINLKNVFNFKNKGIDLSDLINIDEILTYSSFVDNEFKIKIDLPFISNEDCKLTYYFFNKNLPVSNFKFSDFKRKKVILKNNKLVLSNSNITYNTDFFCTYTDKEDNKCVLKLSPLSHYQFLFKIFKIIKLILSKFPDKKSNNYKLLLDNPTIKSNDLIINIEKG